MGPNDNDLQSIIPSASPISALGLDWDKVVASGNPQAYMAAMRAGVPYQPANAAPAPVATSALAKSAGTPQPAVAQAAKPAPAAGTAANQAQPVSQLAQAASEQPTPQAQPTPASVGRNDTSSFTPGVTGAFGQSLADGAAQSQVPATNAPNPQMDSTGAAMANVQPGGGAAEDPNQKIIQQTSQMGIDYSKNLSGQPTLAQTEAPMEAQRPTTPLNPMDSQYRPTKWQRFGRGVLGGVEGLARGGIRGAVLGAVDPAAVGATAYGAPNRAFSIAAQQRAGLTDVINAKEKQAEDVYKEDTGRAKDVITGIKDIGTVAAQGQTAQSRVDVAQARKESADVAGQLANIKQQVADYQSQGKIPTTFEATSAAWALEKDPAKKAALKAALDYDRETEIRKFQYAAKANAGGNDDPRRQPLIDAATAQVQKLNDYQWDSDANDGAGGFFDPAVPNKIYTAREFTDMKNQISTKLDQQLTQKKMKPLGVRFGVADTTPGGSGTAPAAPAAAAPKAAAPKGNAQTVQYKGQSLTVGQTIMVDGKPAVFKGIGPTGKLLTGAQ